MNKEYDLVVLGGGTGGYVAAIRASQLGMQVAIVENEKLGGTCLHHGCIPSKTLLRSAEVYRQTNAAANYGIEANDVTLNFHKVQQRKIEIIDQLHKGVQALIKKGKIDVFYGYGRILGPSIFSPMAGTISIEYVNGDENTMIVPKNILIATGSKSRLLSGIETDGINIMSSKEALNMSQLPKSMIIVGGGVIGVEWASMLADFGVEVTILEYLPQILPAEDQSITKELTRLLKNKGITIITDAQLMADTLTKDKGITVDVKVSGKIETFHADKMLVSVGREANITDIGIENTDINIENNCIQVNGFYQTKEDHIYAIGDVIGGKQLAHVASHEGIVAVEHIAGKKPLPIINENIPTCIYSNPEVASIGLTEEQAKAKGFTIKVGKFPFQAIGKALVYGETEGFVKVIADKHTNDLLGVHMLGPHVTDMISEAGLAKVLDATPWEMSLNIYPHPSLSEIIGEAALAVDGKQIHG